MSSVDSLFGGCGGKGADEHITELVARTLILARDQGDATLDAEGRKPSRRRVPVVTYVRRFTEYGGERAPIVLLLALFYIGRAELQINSRNLYTVLTTAYAVADKYHSDRTFWNCDYARIGGISVRTLNRVEREFLNKIEFDLEVDSKVLERFREAITEAAGMACHPQSESDDDDRSSCCSSNSSSGAGETNKTSSEFRRRVRAAAGPEDGEELAHRPDLEIARCSCVIA
eukprot:TRINITY_DN4840_c3_g2_i1.p2 TRINITY_DN4840_c3_g2~~TRINITY_DN4840_c3_g2_i1.p2  ORF type:complete len:230 (+),score=86.32 TRINITY_DN4840_c3_g2_i1:235-924(+)